MPTIADRVYDNGLTVLDTEANAIHICSSEPATFAAATTTASLGNSTSVSFGAPQDNTGAGGGREVVMAAITDGSITASGTATHFAVVDTVNSRLLVTGALTPSQAVTGGNNFSLGAITVGLPDPA
ncbi:MULTISPECIES: hypothetical protein [Marivita]|uniref:Uncharacterized protein n=1 Tax=Marivita cryptomonadis TaxID=505252 RepID=A0A9Q2NT27_9RHOB|nr:MULTISPECIES: hypothetical protein [Marivita]MCR9169494.1 hypothetical protein [Paracoccaceae bacterium]MBM2322242.1 hypothetical protein [Marivita cryptomonadis]MBM2331824.1 hypothetical protein [Marivita cryptomonadis]MBM2341408.1 hypothetical protein [Marivita cryptomonadis]MBM2346072.1 hypothetical protein [Marivita cryptomonadis]